MRALNRFEWDFINAPRKRGGKAKRPVGKKTPKFKLGDRVRAWGLAKHIGRITFGPRFDENGEWSTYAYKVTFDNEGYGQKWVNEGSLERLRRGGKAKGGKRKSARYEGTVHALKRRSDVDNPWALAHWIEARRGGKRRHAKRARGRSIGALAAAVEQLLR